MTEFGETIKNWVKQLGANLAPGQVIGSEGLEDAEVDSEQQVRDVSGKSGKEQRFS